jgi:hypothetical protein
MKNLASKILLGTVSAFALSTGCFPGATVDVHDNTANTTINDAAVTVNANTDVDTQRVHPGQDMGVTVTVQNVYLVAPDATPPAGHESDAGHLQFYIDDTDGEPVKITADVQVTINITLLITPGPHKVICRVHKHDGTPTTTKSEFTFTIAL